MATATNVPQAVSYNDDDLKRDASREKYKDGWYMLAVDQVTPKAHPEKGDLSFNFRLSPLDPEDQSTRLKPSIYANVFVPLRNEDVEDHQPPSYAKGFWRQFIVAALSEQHPHAPKKIEGVWQYDGSEIEAAEVDAINQQLWRQAGEAAAHFWTNPNELQDLMFFGKLVTTEVGDRAFTNVKVFSNVLPDGEVLVPKEEMLESVEVEIKPVSGKKTSNGGNGAAAKASTKKVSKKKN